MIPPALIEDLRPQSGVRFVLLRGAFADEQATYSAAIIAATAVWRFTVALVAGAEPVLTPLDAIDAPSYIAPDAKQAGMLIMIARLTARAAPSRQADGLAPWPPRIVRWRGPGRGT